MKASDKDLANETLVIGGLVKRPTSVSKNRSALSKEYHSRHTRHIRGQSAFTRPDENSKRYNKRNSLLSSTKMTN